ncbi:MAG: hypothetical protein ACI9AD_001493, partial [Nitriliruptoraceae bacterium]
PTWPEGCEPRLAPDLRVTEPVTVLRADVPPPWDIWMYLRSCKNAVRYQPRSPRIWNVCRNAGTAIAEAAG